MDKRQNDYGVEILVLGDDMSEKEKLSELTVFKFQIIAKSTNKITKLRYDLAKFLSTKGFAPGHWYANWKKLEENVWLIIGGSDRGDPSEPVLSVTISLRDTAPNLAGIEFRTDQVDKVREYAEKKVKPMVLNLLDESKIPYEVIEADATKT